jgi:hypothetical protein
LKANGDDAGGQIIIGSSPFFTASTTTSFIHLGRHTLLEASALGADGAGGQILLNADRVRVRGKVIADANGSDGVGGQVIITGDHIRVGIHADIQATGDSVGGQIAIGTNPLTASPTLADSVRIRRGAVIDASALGEDGVGGQILVGGNKVRIGGTLSATALALDGIGGDIEVAGGTIILNHHADIDVSADQGSGSIEIGTNPNSNSQTTTNLVLLRRGSVLDASATGEGGVGGDITVSATNDIVRGNIDATGNGMGSFGGDVNIIATENVTLGRHADIDVSGNAGDGTVSISGNQ